MGTYTFRWESPADKVSVSGTWDDWATEVELKKENGIFQKQLDLPSKDQTYWYKFVVDGKWDFDHKLITEDDRHGNTNNVLPADHIQPLPAGGRSHHGAHDIPIAASAAIATVGAGATTAALAGQVPLEKDKTKDDNVPGAFPETPGATDEGQQKFPVKPASTSPRIGNPFLSAPGDIVLEDTTYVLDADVTLGFNNYENSRSQATEPANKETSEPTFSVNPLPAIGGYGNPVQLKPGEPVPPVSDVTSNTIESTVRDGNEVKDFSGANVAVGAGAAGLAAGTGAAAAAAHEKGSSTEAAFSPFSVPGTSEGIIPESSLPMGSGTKPIETYTGPTISSAGAGTTTADLAGKVPLEPPRGTITQVDDGESAEKVVSEASEYRNPIISSAGAGTTTADLAGKVPIEPSRSTTTHVEDGESAGKDESDEPEKKGGIFAAVAAGGAAVAGGAAAIASNFPSRIQEALSGINNGKDPLAADSEKDEEETDAVKDTETASNVPEEVKESIKKAHESPEAAANPEAVREKAAVEEELERKVERTDAAGEPGPTVSASQSVTAPAAQRAQREGGTLLVDEDTLPALAVVSGAGLVGAAGAGTAVAETSRHEKEGETNTASKVEEFQKDPVGFPVSAPLERAGDPRAVSATFSKDPTGPNDTAHLKPAADEKTVAETAATGAGAVTGATALHEAFKNDDIGNPSDARPGAAADPRLHSSAFANDPLSASDRAHLKPAEEPVTASDAKDDVLHQKAVASGLNAAASAPLQANVTQPIMSTPTKGPAAAAAAAAMGGAAASSVHKKTESTATTGSLNKPFHGRKVSISPDDISRDASPMTRGAQEGSGVDTGIASAVSGIPNERPDTATSSATGDVSPSSTKKDKKSKRRSILSKLKQAFTVHAT